MIEVQSNRKDFEYDVYSLVKAFYPQEEVSVSEDRTLEDTNLFLWIEIIAIESKKNQITVRVEAKTYQEEKCLLTEDTDRKSTKNHLKQLIYQVLSEYSKKELPWGTLTGIRPIKIPMQLLMDGWTEEAVYSYMKETYLASEEKIQLSIEIAKREKEILQKIDYQNGYSLYIGIPFCPSTCLYCSFTSYPIAGYQNKVEDYLTALRKELHFIAEQFSHKNLNTIYIGGGTPTTLTATQLDQLLSYIEETFDITQVLEFTVEAGRPDSITREKLEALKRHTVTRISINPQTMNQKTLQLIGRHHTVEQTKQAFLLARELGFDNINMDLILGLPEEMLEEVQNTLEQVKELAPDSITVHSLAVKRAARLKMFQEQYESLRMTNSNETTGLAAEYAKALSLEPYYLYRQKNMTGNLENVGYAKENKECIYNILIMEEKQTIVAAGAGAATKMVYSEDRIERIENVKDVTNYIERIEEMVNRKRTFWEANPV